MKNSFTLILSIFISYSINAQDYVPKTGGHFTGPVWIDNSATFIVDIINDNNPDNAIKLVAHWWPYDNGQRNLGSSNLKWKNLWLSNNLYLDGNIGIGTTSFGTHKLAVDGSIGARKIKIEASGWSDFVFQKDYSLRSLEEVEAFIKKNKHLPEIPSESEVKEQGIDVAEINSKLLQKIEELTLYLIQQNKELTSLKNELVKLKNEK